MKAVLAKVLLQIKFKMKSCICACNRYSNGSCITNVLHAPYISIPVITPLTQLVLIYMLRTSIEFECNENRKFGIYSNVIFSVSIFCCTIWRLAHSLPYPRSLFSIHRFTLEHAVFPGFRFKWSLRGA